MILSGQTIRKFAIVSPFFEKTVVRGMSFGCSAAGYDVRVEFDEEGRLLETALAPGGFILASTIECFRMPNDVMGIVHDKSTWARRGLAVQNTVIEPGWFGYLTLELANHGSELLRIRRGDPIAQVVFHQVDQPVEKPYRGKYQKQKRGPVGPRSEDG